MLDSTDIYNSDHCLYQNPRLAAIWNLCYHFFVPQQNIDLLRKQASKLLSCSETPESWAESAYTAIKFTSLQTMNELRKIWQQYTEERGTAIQASYEASRRLDIKRIYDEIYGAGGESLSFSAGPHWERGLNTANEALRRYWRTGVVAGNTTDIEQLGLENRGRVNPMFIVSSVSERFVVHFATDPLSGFHIASAFDGPKNEAKEINEMVVLAKTQFLEWCKAFVDYAKCGSASVNIYFGDAINFCHELSARNPLVNSSAVLTRLYTAPWSAKPLRLDGDGVQALPSTFDIIDTSNLADWIGLHNLLPATTSLLSGKSTSILYTETLRLSADKPENDLAEALFMSVDMASLIIGLTPTGHILGYTTESSHAEDMIHLQGSRRYRIRIPWRVAALGDRHVRQALSHQKQLWPVKFEADELVELFFSIYLKMFAQEDLKKLMQSDLSPDKLRIQQKAFNRYARLSLVTLLQQAKRNLLTDWSKFFPCLLEKIGDDSTLHFGGETLLDLTFHLHVSGVWENSLFTTNPSQVISYRVYTFVTLVVPRRRLKIFERLGSAPGIHLAIIQDDGNENLFFSIDCFFGSIGAREDEDSCGQITEDPLGWAGSSDLLVTCPVPAQLLEVQRKWHCALKVTLSLNSSAYVNELGMDMLIFKASVNDKRHLITSKQAPGIHPSRLETVSSNELAALSLGNEQAVVISAAQSQGRMALRATYTIAKDTEESTALANGAIITLSDHSPCSLLLKIGSEHSRRLLFPYPVNGLKATTRIARKSLWIEVKVPLASAACSGGYDLDPFVVAVDSLQPSVWALPRVDLSKQPLARIKGAYWLDEILGQILSAREKKIIMQSSDSDGFLGTLPALKKTLHHMFLHTGGQHKVKNSSLNKMFVLAGTESRADVSDTLIVSSAVRHSRENGSIILDAWVVPMTRAKRDSLFTLLPRSTGVLTVFQLKESETTLWKQILPAASELCRRGWEHNASCSYLSASSAPLSLEPWESSICSCGEGQDTKEFPSELFLSPFRQIATRIALPALSAVSYTEAMEASWEI
jgi:hypothetical protein